MKIGVVPVLDIVDFTDENTRFLGYVMVKTDKDLGKLSEETPITIAKLKEIAVAGVSNKISDMIFSKMNNSDMYF